MKNKTKLFQITIENKSIEILTVGDFNNKIPVIILLHEGLGSISMWKEIPRIYIK